jgi:RDD family
MPPPLFRLPPDDPRHWVTPDDLNVHPSLLGLPLARPGRRLWAMGVDLAALALLTSVLNGWLLAAATLVLGEHAWAQHRPGRPRRRGLAWGLAALMVLVGLQADTPWEARQDRDDTHASSTADDDTDAADALAAAQRRAAAASATAAAASASTEAALAARVAALEAELAQARLPPPSTVRHWLGRVRQTLDDLGLGIGWALAYFTLLPAWWRGQTLGKRLFGLRVVELTGKPITAALGFKRYGGYAAAMATGGIGLLQLLWDPNRQAIQDKTAHTVVVDLRQPPRQALPAPEATASPATNPPP